MNTKVYDQFVQITQLDNSAVKSIFMHLSNITENINAVKFNNLTLSLKNNSDYTLVYNLEKGNKLPITTYQTLALLFNDPNYLTDDIIINVELTFHNNTYNIYYQDGKINCPSVLNFLFSDIQCFNFFTSIHNNMDNNIRLFEKLFEFIIKKEISSDPESIFTLQFDKYYSGDVNNNIDSESVVLDNEILIEKLLKTKNELFTRINILTLKSSELTQEREKLIDFAQNKEKYVLKYDGLKQDYKILTDQSSSFLKNVNDLQNVIKQINSELSNVSIRFNNNNLPEAEKNKLLEEQSFLIEKKTSFMEALTDAETNLATLTSMLQTTKQNMEATYTDIDLINNASLADVTNYDSKLSEYKKELDDLYIKSSTIDSELNKLQKETNSFNISREYAELKNKGTNDIEYSALKTALQIPIIPSSINIAYRYLVNLFLYHLNKNNNQKLSQSLLNEFGIQPKTFFTLNNNEVIIS